MMERLCLRAESRLVRVSYQRSQAGGRPTRRLSRPSITTFVVNVFDVGWFRFSYSNEALAGGSFSFFLLLPDLIAFPITRVNEGESEDGKRASFVSLLGRKKEMHEGTCSAEKDYVRRFRILSRRPHCLCQLFGCCRSLAWPSYELKGGVTIEQAMLGWVGLGRLSQMPIPDG